jgi:hypothetical protein
MHIWCRPRWNLEVTAPAARAQPSPRPAPCRQRTATSRIRSRSRSSSSPPPAASQTASRSRSSAARDAPRESRSASKLSSWGNFRSCTRSWNFPDGPTAGLALEVNDPPLRRGVEEVREASDPFKEHPSYFVDANIPPIEWPNMWADVPDPAPHEPMAAVAELPPIERRVEAIQSFSVGLGIGRATVQRGEILDEDHEIVRANPELFRRPAQPFKPSGEPT